MLIWVVYANLYYTSNVKIPIASYFQQYLLLSFLNACDCGMYSYRIMGWIRLNLSYE